MAYALRAPLQFTNTANIVLITVTILLRAMPNYYGPIDRAQIVHSSFVSEAVWLTFLVPLMTCVLLDTFESLTELDRTTCQNWLNEAQDFLYEKIFGLEFDSACQFKHGRRIPLDGEFIQAPKGVTALCAIYDKCKMSSASDDLKALEADLQIHILKMHSMRLMLPLMDSARLSPIEQELGLWKKEIQEWRFRVEERDIAKASFFKDLASRVEDMQKRLSTDLRGSPTFLDFYGSLNQLKTPAVPSINATHHSIPTHDTGSFVGHASCLRASL